MTCGSPSVPSGSTERDSAVAPSGTLPAVAMKLPGRRNRATSYSDALPATAGGVGGVVGGQLEVEPRRGRGRRVRHGEAVERLGRAVGGHDLERPLGGLPSQDLDRLGAHVVEPDVPEPLDDPVDRPLVGRVPGPADALGHHLVDPAEDRGLAGERAGVDHAVAATHLVPLRRPRHHPRRRRPTSTRSPPAAGSPSSRRRPGTPGASALRLRRALVRHRAPPTRRHPARCPVAVTVVGDRHTTRRLPA